MIVYQKNKQQFISDVKNDVVAEIIEACVLEKLGRKTAKSEYDSWRNSSVYMRNAVEHQSIPDDCGVSVEYQIPATAKRVDYILSGIDNEDRKNVVIVELKQWSSSEITPMDAIVRAFVGGGVRELTHPSYQAWTYAKLLEGFNEYVYENDIGVYPCAFLHNYPTTSNEIVDECYAEHIKNAPVFRKSEADQLGEFIGKYVCKGDQGQLLYDIEQGKIRPSKKLADALVSMIKGNQEFVLVDEQKEVYETALLKSTQDSETKTVFIVKGEPGSGKTVVAINLLVAINEQRKLCHYVTRNSAPREVYQAKLTGTLNKTQFANLFKGSGSYMNAGKNDIDVLIVDEAHRLNEKSGMFRQGENQIMEIIRASKTSVFFIDPHQRVTMLDIGTIPEIRTWAEKDNAEIIEMELPTQFRCGGSDGYLAWVDNTLEIEETANPTLQGIDYDFRIFDNPCEMRDEIFRLNAEGHTSRLLAGYCWDWVSKKNPLMYDIEFPEHGFKMRWNDFDLGQSWIMHKESIGQVGCIHTSQGLEVDYAGVIIGPDLRVEDGELVMDPYTHPGRDKNLQGFKGRMKKSPEETKKLTDMLIRNTYRTLLTRGLKGCFVYCVDPDLAQRLRERSYSDTSAAQKTNADIRA